MNKKDQAVQSQDGLKVGARMMLVLVFIMWLIKSLELALSTEFYYLGVYPRTLKGSIGIFTAPMVHADIFHLISNSLPILILGVLLFMTYRKYAVEVFLLLYFLTSTLVWIMGREAYHIGASGVVYGLFGFIFFMGFFLKIRYMIIVSFAIFILYGGIFYGIFPSTPRVSWESHLMGMLVGAMLAYSYKDAYLAYFTPTTIDTSPVSSTSTAFEYNYEYKPKNDQDK